MTAIVAEQLHFAYRRRPVFAGLDLRLEDFPVVVLGPNGAGKSTLFGLVAGRLRPRHGAIRVEPGATQPQESGRPRVGLLAQQVRPIRGLRVAEQVAYAAWLEGHRMAAARVHAARALERVQLAAFADRAASRLSGGQLRRLGIAQALVSSPRVLLLDEPTAGLDPDQRRALRDVLREAAATTSIVVSTHQTDDLEAVYRTVVVLSEGEVRYCGDAQSFLALAPADTPPALRAEGSYRVVLGARAPALGNPDR